MKQANLNAVGYARVSSEGQRDNFSISAQIREIERHCQAKGWSLKHVYVDDGKSAWSERVDRRPQFRQLLAELQQERFDVVIVHSLDRWSRNLVVTLQTFKEMSDHRVAFASVSENIDYSTPEGRLFIAMLGAFAQYYSDSLAKHTRKGMSERAIKGFHLGGIPFGYAKCDCCEAGLHPDPTEAEAVALLFQKYAAGSHTLAQLAGWMNDQGFRTRNTKTLTNAYGKEVSGPQKFTLYSVRWILHNPFFAGYVSHGSELHPGKHTPIVSKQLFDRAQQELKKARDQKRTASASYRTYLLKGLVRCVWCGLPVWGETLWHGRSYYRERKMTRSQGGCPNEGKMVRCEVLDEQMDSLIPSIRLDRSWKVRLLAMVEDLDERERVEAERHGVEQKLRRLGKAYIDGLIEEEDYEFQQRVLRAQLDSLVLPEDQTALQVGQLLENLPLLWSKATAEERHSILKGFLESVYVDLGAKPASVVGIKPKPEFLKLFRLIGPTGQDRESSETKNSAHTDAPEPDMTGWWRRGRVELPVQKAL